MAKVARIVSGYGGLSMEAGYTSWWHKVAVFSGVLSLRFPSGSHGVHELEYSSACPSSSGCVPLPLGGEVAWDDGFVWAVPKKRTSHSKKRMRMTHKYLKPKYHYTVCPKCNNLKLLHVLCVHCLKETLKATALMRKQALQEQINSTVEKLKSSNSPDL